MIIGEGKLKKISLIVLVALFTQMLVVPLGGSLIRAQSGSVMRIDPSAIQAKVNTDFTVNVVADVANLWGFQFYVGYNATILELISVVKEPPFEGFIRTNETGGYVYVAGSLPQGYDPISGSENLASITFIGVSNGSCALHLYSTLLLDPLSDPINHTVYDGFVTVSAGELIVPDDYPMIQEAIDNVEVGETIFVRHGTYNESIVVNKTLSLVGENASSTVISGIGNKHTVTLSGAANVTFKGFTVTHASHGTYIGISLVSTEYTRIQDCIVANNGAGIKQDGGGHTEMTGNVILNNGGYSPSPDGGLVLFASNCVICRNEVKNNSNGMIVQNNNLMYHNNFVGNQHQVLSAGSGNVWDNGFDGNYWSDYGGTDLNGEGIGDSPYVIDASNQDSFPLMKGFLVADVNHDAVVNMRDIGLCCNAFGSHSGQPNWNSRYDVNEDGTVNMRDIGLACSNFGKRYT